MLRSTKRKAVDVLRCLSYSSATNAATLNTAKSENLYKFDLKYAVNQYDRNYEQVNALVTVKNEPCRYKEPAIIFPGFEGRIESVQSLVVNLERPVYCMQYPFEKSKNSIVEMADSLVQVLRNNSLLDTDSINIVGHSYGGMIAVELIRRLEKEGKNIRLCLTDSSPHAVKMMSARSFGNVQNVDEFELTLISTLAKDVEFGCTQMLEDAIKSHVRWEDKMNTAIPLIAEKTNYEIEHLKTIASSAHKILQAIHYYNENDLNLNAKTTLIRSQIKILPFPEDFKLSKICKKPIKELRSDGHHFNMLKFSKTAHLINEAFKE